jgi:hypothetical protein
MAAARARSQSGWVEQNGKTQATKQKKVEERGKTNITGKHSIKDQNTLPQKSRSAQDQNEDRIFT